MFYFVAALIIGAYMLHNPEAPVYFPMVALVLVLLGAMQGAHNER